MLPLAILLFSLAVFITAYHTYGKSLCRKIFQLSANRKTPAIELEDNVDYVPTKKSIVFGHHFTSIAGTGPIVGPAIAVIWGWLPALLWVLVGSIFIGAVHDLGSLVVSLRNKGQTVGDIAGKVLTKRARLLFLLILFLALTIVLAIFGLVIARVFLQFPSAIAPCMIQIPLAIAVGLFLHRKGAGLFLPSAVVLVLMYLSVYFGNSGFLEQWNSYLANLPVFTWVVALLLYSYIASTLPVWTLLQPRDYINSLQLITTLGLVLIGFVVSAFIGGVPVEINGEILRPQLEINAPMVRLSGAGLEHAPAIFPFLFITIACGAISGFHCLVSSGTSSKQLKNESDAQLVGYGSMLLEGFLAVIVILACVAGLGLGLPVGEGGGVLLGSEAYSARYSSWAVAGSLSAKVGAFVIGSANFLKSLGLSSKFSIALMGVLVASFAATTLDTACRLQRYVVQELAGNIFQRRENASSQNLSLAGLLLPIKILRNKHGATLFAVGVALILAALPTQVSYASLAELWQSWSWDSAGNGGFILWHMFGATNQLLGGLAFIVITFWLLRNKRSVWFIVLPMIFMLIMPAWAMLHNLFFAENSWVFAENKNLPLIIIAICTLVLELWLIIEAVLAYQKIKKEGDSL